MHGSVYQQRTLAATARVQGTGFWGGRHVEVELHPAAAGTGIRFRRVDLPGAPMIPARASAVQPTQFRTRLACGLAAVDMTEHLLAALYAAGIDNCRIDCNSQELPSLDGSAAGYLHPILAAGIVTQEATAARLAIESAIRVGDDRAWVVALPTPGDSLSIEYRLDYGPGAVIPPCSFAAVLSPAVFRDQIAAARTFVTAAEANHIRSLGLASHVTHSDLLVFDELGPVDNRLRFTDECARHKVLDLIGDLALAGLRLSGRVIAYRSGHALNAKLAAALAQRHEKETRQTSTAAA